MESGESSQAGGAGVPPLRPEVPVPSDPAAGPEAILRLFVAIELPDSLRAALSDLMDRLKKGFHFTPATPAWVSPETMHLTLRFLGPTSSNRVPALIGGLRRVAGAFEPPRLRAMGLGAFPDWRRPRVLWVGMRDKTGRLLPIHDALERWAVGQGYGPEPQPFRPHLTLARFRSLRGTHAAREIADAHNDFRSELFTPPGLSLIRSELRPDGARHTHLAEAPFLQTPAEPAERPENQPDFPDPL